MLGETFRSIRKSKGMTLKDVSEGITTPSSVSQFENGKIKLNFEIMMKLIERLNTSLDEYVFLLNKEHWIPSQEDFREQYKSAYLERNLSFIQNLIQAEEAYSQVNKNIRHRHNVILLKQLEDFILNKPFEEKLMQEIRDYLFSYENWGQYELILFNNFLPYLPRTYIIELTEFIRSKASRYEELHPHLKLKIIVTLNILSQLIGWGYPKLVNQLFKMVDKDLEGTTHLYERNYYQFLYGRYQMSLGMIDYGQEICEKAIHILEEFGLCKQAKLYQQELDKYQTQYQDEKFKQQQNDLS